MNIDYLKIAITIALAVIGWIVGYYFTTKKEIDKKRRDVSIEHLINAYRMLTNEIANREITKERILKFEVILSDIQLFGSSKQIELAKEFAYKIASGKNFEFNSLINDLRNDLRKKIGLQKIEGNVTFIRFENNEKKK